MRVREYLSGRMGAWVGCPQAWVPGTVVSWVLTRAGGTPLRFTSDVRSMMLGLHPIVFLSWSFGPLFPSC